MLILMLIFHLFTHIIFGHVKYYWKLSYTNEYLPIPFSWRTCKCLQCKQCSYFFGLMPLQLHWSYLSFCNEQPSISSLLSHMKPYYSQNHWYHTSLKFMFSAPLMNLIWFFNIYNWNFFDSKQTLLIKSYQSKTLPLKNYVKPWLNTVQ